MFVHGFYSENHGEFRKSQLPESQITIDSYVITPFDLLMLIYDNVM